MFTDSVLAYYQDRIRILSLRAFADQHHSFLKMKVLAISLIQLGDRALEHNYLDFTTLERGGFPRKGILFLILT